jgi:hypothetical protein
MTADVDIIKYASIAKQFCEVLPHDVSTEAWAKDVLRYLSMLYSSAHFLPQPMLVNGIPCDKNCVTFEEWKSIFQVVGKRMGKYSTYWTVEVRDITCTSEEPSLGALDDDLADVYEAMKSGLNSFEQGKFDDALYFWRYNVCFAHWGNHAVSAIRVLHYFVFNFNRAAPASLMPILEKCLPLSEATERVSAPTPPPRPDPGEQDGHDQ